MRGQLERLPATLLGLLRHAAAVAGARGFPVYLVGGAVRDLLLGRETIDLDVVVVGDAVAVALALAGEGEAEARVHERFGTATLAWPDGRRLDLIAARQERYPEPGALPVVAPGTLDDDLRRRDFTINAIAASLAPATFGALADPLGGASDLATGTIRALHAASFRDDPTRVLRAVRYGGRLSFTIEPRTLGWLGGAAAGGALAIVSVDRLLHEFARLLAEPAAATMVEHLATLGILPRLHPALHWDAATARAYAALDRLWPLVPPPTAARAERWMARLALLAAGQTSDEVRRLATALHLPAEATTLLDEVARLRLRSEELRHSLPNSALGKLLDPFGAPAIVTLAALADGTSAAERLRHYLIAVRPAAPALGGDFLRALGVPPGPLYRRALTALRDRKRDDSALTVAGERAFLLEWLADHGALPGREEPPPRPPDPGGSQDGRDEC